jgi:hypothetical protein
VLGEEQIAFFAIDNSFLAAAGTGEWPIRVRIANRALNKSWNSLEDFRRWPRVARLTTLETGQFPEEFRKTANTPKMATPPTGARAGAALQNGRENVEEQFLFLSTVRKIRGPLALLPV